MKKQASIVSAMAAVFGLMVGMAQAVDNVGTGGTITYTDAGGNIVGAPVAGGDVIHTFTSSGTLNIPISASANVLVVAGGGGGGFFGGGGGAGGMIYSSGFSVVGGNNYTVTVGGGGNGDTDGGGTGAQGASSVFATLTAIGGGGGGSRNGVAAVNGAGGGSGGGGSPADSGSGPLSQGGAATSGQGNAGGTETSYGWGGCGGGGAGVAGGNAAGNTAGNGGNGLTNSISGASVYYAGGGGGCTYSGGSGTAGSGGLGGGGAGAKGAIGGNGTANTGGGGGGGDLATGGKGGSGIVIVRYPYDVGSLNVAVTAPANGRQFLPGSSVTATVSVASGTIPYTVTFYTNSAAAWSTSNASANLFTINLGALADGTYTHYATVTDSADPVATAFSVTNTFTVAPDTTAPTPNPMTFAVNPAARDTTSVIMTASTATDAFSPPVQYYFENVSNLVNSGWISSTVWTNTGLTVGTTYGYRVKARDAVPNETAFSAVFNAVPSEPTVTWDANGIGTGRADGTGTWLGANQWWNGSGNCDWNNVMPNNAIIGNGGTGGTITLGTVNAGSVVFTNFTGTYTLSGGSLTQDGGITVATNAGAVAIGAPIAGAGGIVKKNAGLLTLSGDNNYSGGTVINAGTVSISADNNLGAANSNITFNGSGTLSLSATINLGARPIAVNNGATATFSATSGTYNLSIGGAVTGNGGLSWANPSANQSALLTLSSANNTFTGPLTMVPVSGYGGSALFASIGDAPGAGPITFGAGNQGQQYIAYNGTAPLTLNYRQLSLGSSVSWNMTPYFKNNAASAASTVTINTDLTSSGGFGGGVGSRRFGFGGSNTGLNTFAGRIANPADGGVLSIEKIDAGTWKISGNMSHSGGFTQSNGMSILAGTNTYTGDTFFLGTLIFQGAQSVSPSSKLVLGQLGNSSIGSPRFLDDGTGPVSFPNLLALRNGQNGGGHSHTIFVGNNSTANGGSNPGSTATGGILAFGSMIFDEDERGRGGFWNLNITGANGYRLQLGNVTLDWSLGDWATNVKTVLNPTTAPLTITGTVILKSGATYVNPYTLTLDGSSTSGTNLISGTIKDPADFPSNPNARPLNVTKSNTSTWTLSGTNTYSGTTTVSGGTLVLAAGTCLSDTNRLTISSGKLQLNAGVREKVGLLTLGATPSNPTAGTFGSTSSRADNKSDTYFSGTGVLYVGMDIPSAGTVILVR